MHIYGLKNCDTCRKAAKALETSVLVDIRADPLSEALLSRALTEFGDKLVNTRSTTWRNLGEEDRSQDPLALLTAHPALMKRPLIEHEGTLYLGWTKEVQVQLGVS